MPSLSVIIPTHRRAAILAQCLDHLARQTIASELEVIVVSDGHDDDTETLFFDPPWTELAIQFLEIKKSQQGVARNHGVAQASATTCLFIGDDIFLAPDACEIHLKAHDRLKTAILGHIAWDPAVGITPIMRWLDVSGWQFGFQAIEKYVRGFIPADIQHRLTYASHLSIATAIAKKYPFREDITLYGYEDTEWGMRLAKAGVKLFYEPKAQALHHHHLEMKDSLKRMETLGTSASIWATKGFDPRPHGFKYFFYRLSSFLPTIAGRHRRAFLRGMKRTPKNS